MFLVFGICNLIFGAFMKRMLNKIIITLAPLLASVFIRLLPKTMRIIYINFEKVWGDWREGRNVIVAFWHGRLLMMPLVYKGRGISILVSQHRDGELIARTVKRFGIDSVRGSSTRGWMAGIKGLLKQARKGKDIAITPDGPRGPKFHAQMGIIHLSKATGLPIIPMTFSASKKKPLKAGMPLFSPIHFQRACLSAAIQSL